MENTPPPASSSSYWDPYLKNRPMPSSEVTSAKLLTQWEDERRKKLLTYFDTQSPIETSDLAWRVKKREYLSTYVFWLLVGQNVLTFMLVYIALYNDKLKDFSLMIGALTAATLGETAYLLRIVFGFVFKDSRYGATSWLTRELGVQEEMSVGPANPQTGASPDPMAGVD